MLHREISGNFKKLGELMTVEQLRTFISSNWGKVNGVKIVFYGGNILLSGAFK